MPKISFIAKDVTPLSQNNRRSNTVNALGRRLIRAHNLKYPPSNRWPLKPLITSDLQVKVFYLHKDKDRKDADNISKPLWDSLNKVYYDDDKRIKYLETLKVSTEKDSNWENFDVDKMDNRDYHDLVDFLLNTTNRNKKLLYIQIDDYSSKSVRF